jgi:3-oxoacyl-(acyl-carrier-protein) synthase
VRIATDQKRRVAVTDYGALCSLGESVPGIWHSILQYEVGYRRRESPDRSVVAKFFGFVEPDRKRYAHSSFATLMAMNNAATAAVSMNWSMRGYQNTPAAACATGQGFLQNREDLWG